MIGTASAPTRTDRPLDSGGMVKRRVLPVLLLLFLGSGCAALIYEIVWFQLLQFVIGASGISLGVLLGTFMAGMFLGSLALPRYVSPDKHPLRVYAALEVGLGILALLLLVAIPLVGSVYASVVPSGFASVLFRAVLCALLLLPPTILMGATLPAIARYVEATPEGVSWMGFFYCGNIVGAVAGCLLAGFYLLRVHDIATAVFVGVVINLLVAAVGFGLSRVAPHRSSAEEKAERTPTFDGRHRVVYVAIALSGLTALGAEVVWTRLLSLMLGATTYTFSIILAVFLAALGVGSGIGAYLAKTVASPRRALGLCQFFVVAGVAWTAYFASAAIPNWPINPSLTESPWFLFQIDLIRGIWALFPAPILWGASFPLAVAAAAERGQDPGKLMGGVYAANTLGAIVGALAFALLFIPMLGTQNAQRLLMLSAVASALLLLTGMPASDSERDKGSGLRGPAQPTPGRFGAWAGVGLVIAVLLVWNVPAAPPVLVAYGRYAPTYYPPNALYMGEGINSSVAVTELDNGVRNLHVGGKVVASTEPQDMRLQRLLGHMTALLHDEPRSVLIVGFGAGVTAGSFVPHPSVERIVIVEIEPLVTRESAEYFARENHGVLDDPRVEVIIDDARHYLVTSDETFDLITADPIHPWMKGAAALYTEEYFDLAREHLNPGGVITQWVPLYESTAEVVKSEIATFFGVFPDGTVWGNTKDGEGYDVILAAKDGGLRVDVEALALRLGSPEQATVSRSLFDAQYRSVLDLLSTYAGRASELAPWLQDAEINRDGNLRLQYLAGFGLNRYEQADIYREILSYRSFPGDLFVGSLGWVQAVQEAIATAGF